MGQVPAFSSFLVVGNGRLARHLRRYFELEALPYYHWHRISQQNFSDLVQKSSHILLAISDGAIAQFISEHAELKSKIAVHFSGALSLSEAPSAHPLMTFAADELYDLETYRKIPFVLEQGRANFADLLPGLKNNSYQIPAEQKGLYHALCALSGNFTVLLWEKVFLDFETKLGLPKDALLPYLHRVSENLALSSAKTTVLTGPLARGDNGTIQKHLAELNNDPYRDVYMAFVQAYGLSKTPGKTSGGVK